jgi:Cu-Zn family superoxide dismutase
VAVDASVDASGTTAHATFTDARGAIEGDALLRETPNGIVLKVNLADVEPGIRGFHIHENGTCQPPGFTSAGGHFAPEAHAHGILDEKGPHAGDLPNIHVPATGEIAFELFLKDLSLSRGARALLDPNGAALILHAKPDDYSSDPAGEAGDRIACAVITR